MPYNTVPVVVKDGPEKAQGVYRLVDADFGTWSPMAAALVLGYLASIWAQVKHPSFPEEGITRENQTGEGFWDCAEHFKNFQISYVVVDVKEVPAGADMIFGTDPLVFVGRGAFFVGSAAKHGLDYILEPVLPLKATIQVAAGFNSAPPGEPFLPPQVDNVIGINRGALSGTDVLLPVTQTSGGISAVFTGTLAFGGEAKQPPAATKLSGNISVNQKVFFPLKQINFMHSLFVPDDPTATGFWWQLKPGVVADITIGGTLVEPYVEIGGSEGGSARFNPMKGEDLPNL